MIKSGNSKNFSLTEMHRMRVTRQELRLEKQARAPGGGRVCRAKASELGPVVWQSPNWNAHTTGDAQDDPLG